MLKRTFANKTAGRHNGPECGIAKSPDSALPSRGRFQLWVSVARTSGNRPQFVLPCRRDPEQLAKSLEQE